jgi:olfactory receptor
MAGEKTNTTIIKFILLGFSDFPMLKIVLFVTFMGTYLSTAFWN